MWKRLDIAGRTLLLLAIFLQLSFLGATEEAKDEAYRYYDLEGQTYMRYALRYMAEGDNEGAIDSLRHASRFLYSNYEASFATNETSTWYLQEQRLIYGTLFAVASAMLLLARIGELKALDRT
ncbi:MAG: hypothetical protein AAGI89_15380 [Pseudomonadota bacterium]